MTDPCIEVPTTTFNVPLPACPDIVAPVLGGPSTVNVDFDAWKDTVSMQRGKLRDGYTLCGSGATKTFELTP